jgi:hypothetical protein
MKWVFTGWEFGCNIWGLRGPSLPADDASFP